MMARAQRCATELPRPAVAALALVCALALMPHAAAAETRVSGRPEAVRLEARDASLDEVFGALAAKFTLHYRAKIRLDRRVSGVFSGSLSRVIARLLDGYDHVVKHSPEGLDVTVFGGSPQPGAATSREQTL